MNRDCITGCSLHEDWRRRTKQRLWPLCGKLKGSIDMQMFGIGTQQFWNVQKYSSWSKLKKKYVIYCPNTHSCSVDVQTVLWNPISRKPLLWNCSIIVKLTHLLNIRFSWGTYQWIFLTFSQSARRITTWEHILMLFPSRCLGQTAVYKSYGRIHEFVIQYLLN